MSGNYASAESLLRDLVQRSDAPTEALDLLAKICIQQGRVLEAGGLWRRALEKDQGNTAYLAALARLNRLQQRPVLLSFLWPGILALAVVAVCLAVIQIQSIRHRAELARLEGLIEQAQDTTAKSTEIGRLSQSVDAVKIQQGIIDGQIGQAQRELKGLTSTSTNIVKTSRNLLAVLSRQGSLVHPHVTGKAVSHGAAGATPEVSAPLQLDMQVAGVCNAGG
jgi:tetratricopeptide (TPR) repeat protein